MAMPAFLAILPTLTATTQDILSALGLYRKNDAGLPMWIIPTTNSIYFKCEI